VFQYWLWRLREADKAMNNELIMRHLGQIVQHYIHSVACRTHGAWAEQDNDNMEIRTGKIPNYITNIRKHIFYTADFCYVTAKKLITIRKY
jgi:hypothetical protein